MNRSLLIGGYGMLGSDLASVLQDRGISFDCPTIAELDITQPETLAERILPGAYDWVINCAAYTAVDKAETEREAAYLANAIGPGYLAQACGMAGCKLLHISTDFVFDGTATQPIHEDEPTRPIGYYGESKRDGEESVRSGCPMSIILRTSWLYGPNGGSFPRTIARAWDAGRALRVVADQFGKPTYTGDLARVIADVMAKNLFPGVYHACGPDAMSWHDFAQLLLEVYEAQKAEPRPVEIEPIETADYPTPARRPAYSVLSTEKIEMAGIEPMRGTEAALIEFFERGLAIPGWPN